MKKYLLVFFFLLKLSLFSQTLKNEEKELWKLFQKLNYFVDNKSIDDTAYDSIELYNIKIEKLVLKITSKFPESLTYNFKELNNGLNIITSEDGQFRIYNWGTEQGGTMHYYKNIFQYRANGKVYSKLSKIETEEDDYSVNYFVLNDVIKNNKHYYVTNSIFVGSSAVYYYEAKIFSIEDGKLNDNAKLIKTKSGIKNTLGYEIDLANEANRNRKDGVQSWDYMGMEYDKKNKTIIIPLVTEDGKVTKSKIKYKFTGKYFEKI